MTDIRKELERVLAKPLPDDDQTIHLDAFDPWEDVIHGIYGCYSSESDEVMIATLKAVRNRTTFDLIKERGFIVEFMLYILAGHGLTEYGTSPRGGWPDHDIEDLWQPLIDKWEAYAQRVWPSDTVSEGLNDD